MRCLAPLLSAVCAVMLLFSDATAADRRVDLELVLAADISGSMDLDEATLQREGFVQALRHPQVISAITSGRHGRIAVAYMEWAGAYYQNVLVGWTEISDAASANAFADKVAAPLVGTEAYTSISTLITAAAASFADNGFFGERQVIDISGDGPNNRGEYVVHARDRALDQGIVINGLPIVNDRPSFFGLPPLKNLDLYYQDCVIGGPGSFIVVANGFDDFARAILRKMVLEIAGGPVRRPLFHFAAERVRPPCNAGELQLRKWRPGLLEDF